MTVTGQLYPVAAMAHLLGDALGLGKQWTDFLNDCRMERGSIKGLRFYPLGHESGDPDHTSQPRYHPDDFKEFVRQVRAAYGGMAKPFPIKIETYVYDDTRGLEAAAWKFRRVTPVKPAPTGASKTAGRS